MSDELKFSNVVKTDEFYSAIDILVKKHKLSYIDAIVHYCEKNEIEIETAASMIKGNFKIRSQLQQEGETLRILPGTARLPI